NIRPEEIIGSGRGGRITARDVENFIENRAEAPKAAPPVSAPSGNIPSHMVPHNALRRSTARHMVESMLNTAPHVTAVFDADLSGVVAHRAKNKAIYESKGVKLTFTAYFVHAAAQALLAVPEVNSRWHDDALEIFDECNIGVAAATDAGLIVPVLHRAEKLSLLAIAEQLQSLTEKARAGKLAKADVQNGTFTITNHGMTGSIIATPIINQPQSAILGIGKMEKRFVVVEKNGQDVPEIKPMAYVTLTIDHRALDGFQANQFLSAFVETLQSWR
ncbi:MAG: dihydrolipoamide acetyltransferase family protein, partial [Calditrichia bacterium]